MPAIRATAKVGSRARNAGSRLDVDVRGSRQEVDSRPEISPVRVPLGSLSSREKGSRASASEDS